MRPRFLLAVLLSAPLAADELTLADGGKVSGDVLELSADGRVKANLKVSHEPVEFRAEQVEQVLFQPRSARNAVHDARLTLVNDDVLPCDLVSIDDEHLNVRSDSTGDLRIPRAFVRTVQLGVRPSAVIYSGPENLAGWDVKDHWHYEEGNLVSSGRGSVSRKFRNLPDSFSLSFRLHWERQPNFQLYFCSSSSEPGGGKHDRYYLQFAGAGFELKRQSSGDVSYHSLAGVPVNPDTFEDKQVDVRIHVDRPRQQVSLFINGELEGHFPDPLEAAPDGKLVIFHSNLNDEGGHRISKVEVREWDPQSERHRSEDRGDPKLDALIDAEGQRFGGAIATTDAQGKTLRFKSPHFPEPLEIPVNRISTLFFREKEAEAPKPAELKIGLGDNGSLTAESCEFTPDELKLVHPLLGDVTLERDAVLRLARPSEANDSDEKDREPVDSSWRGNIRIGPNNLQRIDFLER